MTPPNKTMLIQMMRRGYKLPTLHQQKLPNHVAMNEILDMVYGDVSEELLKLADRVLVPPELSKRQLRERLLRIVNAMNVHDET